MSTRLALWGALGVILLAYPFKYGRDTLTCLAFGWWKYAWRVVPDLMWDMSGLVTTAVCLVLFVGGLHLFCRWIYRHQQAAEAAPQGWRWRWTGCLAGLTLTLAVAGIAMVGAVHQVAWLAAGKKPVFVVAVRVIPVWDLAQTDAPFSYHGEAPRFQK